MAQRYDVLSMTGRGDLATRDKDNDYLAWWTSSGKRNWNLKVAQIL